MASSSWSLDAELKKLVGQENLTSWLRSLGLIEPLDALDAVETVRDWYRSGAETYGLHFALAMVSGRRLELFMKACVTYSTGVPLKDIFAEWLERRALVSQLGVQTPRLYASGEAELVEEYIPYTLHEAASLPGSRDSLLNSIGLTAAKLVNAGFVPISSHDWRSHGGDVVLVDFGQDLGPAGMSRGGESGLLSEILDNLSRDGAKLSAADLKIVGSSYEDAIKR